MPFSFHCEGIEELISLMDQIPQKGARIASEALYEGAGIVADSVSQAVSGIATEPFKYATNGRTRKPSPEEKAIVAGARHGVAKFKNNGMTIQTSIGFQKAGYAAITWNHARTNTRTKYKVQNGSAHHASRGGGESSKPVAVIANAINSGTSFMDRQPFLNKAFSKSKSAAIAAIEGGIQSRISELELG